MADIIDFESSDIEGIVASYSTISDGIGSINVSSLSSCSFINGLCGDAISKVNEQNDEILDDIASVASDLTSILSEMEAIDQIENVGVYSFGDLLLLIQSKKEGSNVKRADADFFRSLGYDVVDGVVTITSDEGTYSYNVETSILTNPDGTTLQVNYFYPENMTDPTKTNTVTCLAGQGEMDVYSPSGDNSFFLDSMKTNSLLVCPSKLGQNISDLKKVSYSFMANQVIYSTKFATLFLKQGEGCQNSIGGCSSGGGSALKIASQGGDLYDTVFCINYAPLIAGKNAGGKGKNGADNNQMTEEEARNLNGKNIFIISSSSDPNIKGDGNSICYKGVKLLTQYCPESKIYFATNAQNKGFNTSSPNYEQLNEEFWNTMSPDPKGAGVDKHQYRGHGAYHGILHDLISSGIMDQNYYNE